MLYWAGVFFFVAIACATLSIGTVVVSVSGIAQMMFFVFIVVAVMSLILGLARKRT